MPDKITIAKRLIDLRAGKPRDTVATACKISRSALTMYEHGERTPRDAVKVRLAEYYGVSVQSIFYE